MELKSHHVFKSVAVTESQLTQTPLVKNAPRMMATNKPITKINPMVKITIKLNSKVVKQLEK